MTLPGGHDCPTALPAGGWAPRRTGCTTGGRAPHSGRGTTQEVAPQSVLELEVRTSTQGDDVWVFLRGEADLGNHHLLQVALSLVQVDEVEHVHLVLADLTFCDLYAFRDLVAFASRVQATGLALVAHGARPILRKMATVVDVTRELRFA